MRNVRCVFQSFVKFIRRAGHSIHKYLHVEMLEIDRIDS